MACFVTRAARARKSPENISLRAKLGGGLTTKHDQVMVDSRFQNRTVYRMDQLSALSGPELVFGLVGAVGSDLKAVTRTLISELERVRYKVEEIHVSSLLHQLDRYAHLGKGGFDSEYERIREHMKAGTDLRNETAAGEAMALLAIAAIRQRRITRQPSLSREDAANRPLERTAFVIRSLKHPDEIQALRYVYGRAFSVISTYSPRQDRVEELASIIARAVHRPIPSTGRGAHSNRRAGRVQARPECSGFVSLWRFLRGRAIA